MCFSPFLFTPFVLVRVGFLNEMTQLQLRLLRRQLFIHFTFITRLILVRNVAHQVPPGSTKCQEVLSWINASLPQTSPRCLHTSRLAIQRKQESWASVIDATSPERRVCKDKDSYAWMCQNSDLYWPLEFNFFKLPNENQTVKAKQKNKKNAGRRYCKSWFFKDKCHRHERL